MTQSKARSSHPAESGEAGSPWSSSAAASAESSSSLSHTTEPMPSAATAPGPDTRPDLCWSRHFDNIGKPRPTAVWSITYGCENGHEITTNLCDRCASSLVDGRQHCAVCVRRMTVTSLTATEAARA